MRSFLMLLILRILYSHRFLYRDRIPLMKSVLEYSYFVQRFFHQISFKSIKLNILADSNASVEEL